MTDADWVQQERDHEYRMAKLAESSKEEERRERARVWRDRREVIGWVVFALTVVSVVAVIVFSTARVIANNAHAETERINACSASGGTWMPLANGPDLCLHFDGKEVLQ